MKLWLWRREESEKALRKKRVWSSHGSLVTSSILFFFFVSVDSWSSFLSLTSFSLFQFPPLFSTQIFRILWKKKNDMIGKRVDLCSLIIPNSKRRVVIITGQQKRFRYVTKMSLQEKRCVVNWLKRRQLYMIGNTSRFQYGKDKTNRKQCRLKTWLWDWMMSSSREKCLICYVVHL